LLCGTPTVTSPEHIPPFPSSAVNPMWYTLPFSFPDLSALTCAVSVPIPAPSGDVFPEPFPLTASSWNIESIVMAMSSPSESVTPKMETSTIL